ncbi:hypothetical protein GPJ56_009744 [Histomonas meleagridis]|uniref:uncharacterized protein n=1 Tax=Histomonas meleagridis TaxID=135588 RepID=UPI0035593A3E|nr:hypothetical protein GPJ56_009744 [Histomonas meleagridis]KAH0802306.1 hypothetical protein GO595_004919 [Histomonas meleagridis]
MNTWKKIKATLKWTIANIDLGVNIRSKFVVMWQRGDSKGQTDSIFPDNENKLNYNAQFECPCTMFVSKSNGSIRTKNVSFKLMRYIKGKKKLYGKIIVDVAPFFGLTDASIVSKEMESGRSNPPIFNASFFLQSEGEIMEMEKADLEDVSFIGHKEERVPLSSWDVTEVTPVMHKGKPIEVADEAEQTSEGSIKEDNENKEDQSQNEESKTTEEQKGHQEPTEEHAETAEAEQKEEKVVETAESTEKVEIKEENEEKVEEHKEEQEKKEEKTQENKEEQEKKEEENEENKEEQEKKEEVNEEKVEENKEEQEKVEEHKETEEKAVENAEQQNAEEKLEETIVETKATEAPKEEIKAAEAQAPNADELLHTIFTTKLPILHKAPLFAPKTLYPSAVFPIFSTILHTNLLSSSNPNFESNLNTFETEFPNSKTKEKVATIVVLSSLIKHYQHIKQFDAENASKFTSKLDALINPLVRNTLHEWSKRSRVIINRLSTATFDFDTLLADFKQIIEDNKKAMKKYSPLVRRHLIDRYILKLDSLIANKLISNPKRFSFGNGVIWNSLLSAVENDERISLYYSKQVISCLVMAEGIAQTPSMKNYIAPDLNKKNVYYILRNFHTDENIPNKISPRSFAKEYKIKKEQRKNIKPKVKTQKPSPITIENESNANLEDWNKIRKTEKILKLFPFMEEFVVEPRKDVKKVKVKKIKHKQESKDQSKNQKKKQVKVKTKRKSIKKPKKSAKTKNKEIEGKVESEESTQKEEIGAQ